MTELLRGVGFAHPRIMEPLRAAAAAFAERRPEVSVGWSEHSLQDFEELSLCQLSERFDIFAFDHPLLGDGIPQGCVLDLAVHRPGLRDQLAPKSLGLSLESYSVGPSLYGVPFDGAVQNSAWVREKVRNDSPPSSMEALQRFVEENGPESVALPLLPAHAGCTFLTIAASVEPLSSADARFYLDPRRIATSYAIFCALVEVSTGRSKLLDPIHLLEEMANGGDVIYSPFVFGYGLYASGTVARTPLAFGPSLAVGSGINRGVLGGAGIGVSASAVNRESALDFVEFLMSDAVMEKVVGTHRGQGGLRNGWTTSSNPEMNEFFFSSTRSAMDFGIVRPRFSGFVEFLMTVGEELIGFAEGQAPVADVVSRIPQIFEDSCRRDPELEAIVYPSPDSPYSGEHQFSLPANSPLDGEPEAADRC